MNTQQLNKTQATSSDELQRLIDEAYPSDEWQRTKFEAAIIHQGRFPMRNASCQNLIADLDLPALYKRYFDRIPGMLACFKNLVWDTFPPEYRPGNKDAWMALSLEDMVYNDSFFPVYEDVLHAYVLKLAAKEVDLIFYVRESDSWVVLTSY